MIAQDCARACCSAGSGAFGGDRRTAEPLRGGVGLVAESGFPEGGPGGEAGQGALQVRPCKLGRRIHAAHAPALPPRPALDRSLRLTHHGKSTTRAKSGSLRSQSRPRQPTAVAFAVAVAFSLDLPVVGTGGRKLSRAGWVGRAGVSDLAPTDGFTASPDPPTHPAKPMNPSFQRPTHPTTEGLRRSPTPPKARFPRKKEFPTDVSIPSPLVRCTQ